MGHHYFTVLKKQLDEKTDRAYVRTINRPPLNLDRSNSEDVLQSVCPNLRTLLLKHSEAAKKDLTKQNLRWVQLYAPSACERKDVGDCRAILMRRTELELEEHMEKTLKKTRNELITLSKMSEPGPQNLALPTMNSILENDIKSFVQAMPATKAQRSQISLLHDFPLPDRIPSGELVFERHFVGGMPAKESLRIGTISIALQDIDAYLNGGEMPPMQTTDLSTSTAIDIPGFCSRFNITHPCSANIRMRSKPTASLPWHLFGQIRSFWSDNLVGKPSELSRRVIEQAVRPLSFCGTNLMGQKRNVLDVLKQFAVDDLNIPEVYCSRTCLTSVALLQHQIRNTRAAWKAEPTHEDVSTFFIEAKWAQGPTFNRNSEQLRNKLLEMEKRCRNIPFNVREQPVRSDGTPSSDKDVPSQHEGAPGQMDKRKTNRTCEDEEDEARPPRKRILCA